jgi:hypothetical protein
LFGRAGSCRTQCNDDIHVVLHQFGSGFAKSIGIRFRKLALDCDVLTVHVTKFVHPDHESLQGYAVWTGILRAAGRENTYSRYLCSLLRTHDARPCRHAADERNKFAPPHSITSSAVVSSDCGIVMPSTFAVLRLITNSYLVGACTGISAGFSPLRMRSTYSAALRCGSLVLGP